MSSRKNRIYQSSQTMIGDTQKSLWFALSSLLLGLFRLLVCAFVLVCCYFILVFALLIVFSDPKCDGATIDADERQHMKSNFASRSNHQISQFCPFFSVQKVRELKIPHMKRFFRLSERLAFKFNQITDFWFHCFVVLPHMKRWAFSFRFTFYFYFFLLIYWHTHKHICT